MDVIIINQNDFSVNGETFSFQVYCTSEDRRPRVKIINKDGEELWPSERGSDKLPWLICRS